MLYAREVLRACAECVCSCCRHRAINIFARTYHELWLQDENVGQEVMIEDLTQSFEDAELKKSEAEEEEGKPDPLTQLVTTFCRGAMTERSGALQEDPLYMSYAEIIAKSCGEEEEEGEDEGGEDEEGGASIHVSVDHPDVLRDCPPGN